MTPAEPTTSFTWTVKLLPGGDTAVGALETVLCFSGAPPDHVGPENLRALPWLMDLPRPVNASGGALGPPLRVDAQGIVTRGLAPGECVSFSVDIEGAAKDLDDRDVATVAGRQILASPDAWLWRPSPWPAHAVGRLVVEHAIQESTTRIAVPMLQNPDGSYQVPRSTFALQCFAVLGDFESTDLEIRGATFQVVRIDAGGIDDETFTRWLHIAVDDVAVPLQAFPVSQVLLLLLPVSGAREVDAGFLGRGGGASALFLLGRGPFDIADDPEILDDDGRWVFTHELAHTLLPPVARGDGWLNEGLTTWHQEVLPAAAGRRLRTVSQGQLEVGFRTGRARARQDGLSVKDSCSLMESRGSYQHCYWAGARLFDLLSKEVGDDGVFALVATLHAAGAVDAAPQSALRLLKAVSSSADPRAYAAAQTLLGLWEQHQHSLFPDPLTTPAAAATVPTSY